MSRLDDWTVAACDALGLDAADVDRDQILDLARDVAHGVARPAAPLTTYLVGLAAGRNGGSPAAVRDAVDALTVRLGQEEAPAP